MKKAYIQYILALLLFGSNGIVAGAIALNSYEIVLLRTFFGSLFLAVIFKMTRRRLTFYQKKRDFLYLASSGAAMGASWMLLYEAYQEIGVGVATLAYYCGPVIVMALSAALFQERLTRRRITGFFAVLLGMGLVNIQALHGGKSLWGLFCGGMAAVMYACMVICNKKAQRITGLENSFLQLFVSFLTVAVFVLAKQGLGLRIASEDWLPILILGFVNTGAGCYLYFSSIGRLPVQTVAVCGYLEPLSAVLLSAVFLDETCTAAQILGGGLMIGGAVFAQWQEKRNRNSSPPV